MKTDRIFVLLLVVMLPMSGCFDDAVGDAEGADDTTSETTVINNYYNNTTANVPAQPLILYVPTNTTANITTAVGELVEVLDVWSSSSASSEQVTDWSYVASEFMCSTHTTTQTAIGIGIYSQYSEMGSDWLPTDGTSCVYNFDRTNVGDLYIIYRIV